MMKAERNKLEETCFCRLRAATSGKQMRNADLTGSHQIMIVSSEAKLESSQSVQRATAWKLCVATVFIFSFPTSLISRSRIRFRSTNKTKTEDQHGFVGEKVLSRKINV